MSQVTEVQTAFTKDELGSIAGFHHYSMQEHQAFFQMRDKVQRVFFRHGFAAFVPRPVELMSVLLAKGGIGKQIFSLGLRDGTPTRLGLPFDRTVSLALYIAEMGRSFSGPLRRSDINLSFRGESPQAGRFRAFSQADVDIIDRKLPLDADVECVATIYDALSQLQVGPFVINFNNIKLARAVLDHFKITDEQKPDVLRILDKMDKLDREEIGKQLAEIIDPSIIEVLLRIVSFNEGITSFTEMVNEIDPALLEKCLPHVRELTLFKRKLQENGVDLQSVSFCPRMVRGLDYYTGIVYETFLVGKEQYGSIASGGRYSKLVDAFLGEETGIEGTGGSIGLTRLFDICTREEMIPLRRATQAQVMIAFRKKEFRSPGNVIGRQLRERDINVDVYVGTGRTKEQLKYANRLGIPFVILLVDPERYVVKNMTTGKQSDDLTSMEEALSTLEGMINLENRRLAESIEQRDPSGQEAKET